MEVVKLAEAEKLSGEGYILHRMINPLTVGSKNMMSFVVTINPGGAIPEHKHGPAEVAIHFLEGSATVTIGGEEQTIEPETSVFVPIGAGIGLKNTGDGNLKFIALLSPPIDVTICSVCGVEAKTLK